MSAHRQFQLVYAFLTLNFLIPSVGYLLDPALAIAQFERIGTILGAGPYPYAAGETGWVWRILAGGNVMTLSFMCALLLWDLRRFFPVLWPLVFMKGLATLLNLAVFAVTGYPAFLAIFVYDGLSAAAMVYFARRALDRSA